VASENEGAEEATATLKANKFDFVKCKDGPKKVFTVSESGKSINVFMGDMNDFLNIECLYLMDAVVTVGKISHVNNVVKIFKKPGRDSEKVVKKMNTPFTNKKLKPSKVKKTKVNKNMSVVRFRIGNKETKKSLIFYHIFKKGAHKQSKRTFKNIAKKIKNKKFNVLYVVDHLQEKSLSVFRNFLEKYGKYSKSKIDALKYKKKTIFQ